MKKAVSISEAFAILTGMIDLKNEESFLIDYLKEHAVNFSDASVKQIQALLAPAIKMGFYEFLRILKDKIPAYFWSKKELALESSLFELQVLLKSASPEKMLEFIEEKKALILCYPLEAWHFLLRPLKKNGIL